MPTYLSLFLPKILHIVELISPGRSSSSSIEAARLFGGGDSERLSDRGRFLCTGAEVDGRGAWRSRSLSRSRSAVDGLPDLMGWEEDVALVGAYLSREPAREPFAGFEEAGCDDDLGTSAFTAEDFGVPATEDEEGPGFLAEPEEGNDDVGAPIS